MAGIGRKGCFKCRFPACPPTPTCHSLADLERCTGGAIGHIAEACSAESRLCFNCKQPGHVRMRLIRAG